MKKYLPRSSNQDPMAAGSSQPGHNSAGITATTQNQGSYAIEVTSDTGSLEPQQQSRFTYKIKNDMGVVVKDFAVMHEKIMHLIAVRKDLREFLHLHPDYNQQTGEFSVGISFPTDGPYRLFPDFTIAENNPKQLPTTLSYDVTVGEITRYKAQPLTAEMQNKKMVNGYGVTYAVPTMLKPEQETQFSITVEQGGKPVANLEQYIGALGHSVIIKENTLDFLHTHALTGANTAGMEHGQVAISAQSATGPTISFAATFPQSGRYKIFSQFQDQGNVQTVNHVVEVQ